MFGPLKEELRRHHFDGGKGVEMLMRSTDAPGFIHLRRN